MYGQVMTGFFKVASDLKSGYIRWVGRVVSQQSWLMAINVDEHSVEPIPQPVTRDPDGAGPVIQAMLVLRLQGQNETSLLRVFRIPKSQEESYYEFLSKNSKYTKLLANLQKPGFVRLDKLLSLLNESATDYAKHCKDKDLPCSHVRWETVPMEEGSVVFFCGVHMVTECREPEDVRVVRYLRLQSSARHDPLPATLAQEPTGPGFPVQGKGYFPATEEHLVQNYGAELGYGFNCTTIPVTEQGYFTQALPHPFVPQKDAAKTQVQKHLEEFGWAVLPKVLSEVACMFRRIFCSHLFSVFRTN